MRSDWHARFGEFYYAEPIELRGMKLDMKLVAEMPDGPVMAPYLMRAGEIHDLVVDCGDRIPSPSRTPAPRQAVTKLCEMSRDSTRAMLQYIVAGEPASTRVKFTPTQVMRKTQTELTLNLTGLHDEERARWRAMQIDDAARAAAPYEQPARSVPETLVAPLRGPDLDTVLAYIRWGSKS
jgi:hypothetical protein